MEKHIKHKKMVISTKSLTLIETLCFRCAKTISFFSLAKQYSSYYIYFSISIDAILIIDKFYSFIVYSLLSNAFTGQVACNKPAY